MRLPYFVRAGVGSFLRNRSVRVKAGPCEGYRWSLASSGRGYGRGDFEKDRVDAILACVRPGDHVWDLGAHKGYVSFAMGRAVGSTGTVSSLEPSEQNLWFFRKHLEWNRPPNVRLIEAAVGGADGEERFGGHGSTIQFHLGEGDEVVRVATMPTLHEVDGLPRPDFLKFDIEGAELPALRAAGDMLHDGVVAFVSLHSWDVHDGCVALFEERGFTLHPSHELQLWRSKRAGGFRWRGDPDILAVGPDRSMDPEFVRGLRHFRPLES